MRQRKHRIIFTFSDSIGEVIYSDWVHIILFPCNYVTYTIFITKLLQRIRVCYCSAMFPP